MKPIPPDAYCPPHVPLTGFSSPLTPPIRSVIFQDALGICRCRANLSPACTVAELRRMIEHTFPGTGGSANVEVDRTGLAIVTLYGRN